MFQFLTMPFCLFLIGPSFLKGKETALDIVERRLREERPEDAGAMLTKSETSKIRELSKVASYLKNDQVADQLFVDGPSSLTINVLPG